MRDATLRFKTPKAELPSCRDFEVLQIIDLIDPTTEMDLVSCSLSFSSSTNFLPLPL